MRGTGGHGHRHHIHDSDDHTSASTAGGGVELVEVIPRNPLHSSSALAEAKYTNSLAKVVEQVTEESAKIAFETGHDDPILRLQRSIAFLQQGAFYKSNSSRTHSSSGRHNSSGSGSSSASSSNSSTSKRDVDEKQANEDVLKCLLEYQQLLNQSARQNLRLKTSADRLKARLSTIVDEHGPSHGHAHGGEAHRNQDQDRGRGPPSALSYSNGNEEGEGPDSEVEIGTVASTKSHPAVV